jgi:hypothetical protein
MTPAEIAQARGAEYFEFDYANADVADIQIFSGDDWGLYSADSVAVADAITPDVGDDGTTSIPGSITFSVTLYHLDTFTTSHVQWDGSGITVEYTLDGETWFALAEDAVIDLAGDPDFDIRVTFDGGVVEDPAILNSITVYVFGSESITANQGRKATFTDDVIHDGIIVLRGGRLDVESDTRDPVTPVAAIEFWATVDGASGLIVQSSAFTATLAGSNITATGCTVYVNGAPFTSGGYVPTDLNHYVIVPTVTTSAEFTVGLVDMTLTHLALYPAVPDIPALYAAQSTGIIFRVDDSDAGPVVTEYDTAVDIYAFSWTVVAGSSS